MTVSELRYRLDDLADDAEITVHVQQYTQDSSYPISAHLVVWDHSERIILKLI